MLYLDYSATTPPNAEVLKEYLLDNYQYFANANTLYSLGKNSKKAIKTAEHYILKNLKLINYEVVFTSSATEANNLVIKGLAEQLKGEKKRIITTTLEHPSIIAPINDLVRKGFVVDLVSHHESGEINLEHLKELLGPDVAFVSLCSLNSETGVRQPIKEISKLVREAGAYFHCDVTQTLGKERFDFNLLDLMTFSAHKFYGLQGIGALIKKKDIKLVKQIHGGHSASIYRSGTPSVPLIRSLWRALSIANQDIQKKYKKVQGLNNYLRSKLEKMHAVVINSPLNSIPHILNFSLLGKNSNKVVNQLSKKEIYISNHTACTSQAKTSNTIFTLTQNKKRATSSLRVSISHLTSRKDLKYFVLELEKLQK